MDVETQRRRDERAPDGPTRLGPERVPVDERVLGLDRRSIWPGVVLLVVWAIWSQAMPWIDNQISLDDPIVAGDVVNLGLGEITFEPIEGWNLESGLRLVEGEADRVPVPTSAAVSSDLVSYTVATGFWEGTADELLDRMLEVNDALDYLIAKDEQGRTSISNADGVDGRVVYVRGAEESVLIAAYVFTPEPTADGASTTPYGVEIEVRGQTEDLQDQLRDIGTMLFTTVYRPIDQEAQS